LNNSNKERKKKIDVIHMYTTRAGYVSHLTYEKNLKIKKKDMKMIKIKYYSKMKIENEKRLHKTD